MLSRKNEGEKYILLPEDFNQGLEESFNSTYIEILQQFSKKIEIISLTFSDELVIYVSFKSEQKNDAPITLEFSVDKGQNTDLTKTADKLLENSAIYFEYLSDKHFEDFDYSGNWESEEKSGLEFFYRITREDPKLTVEADKLLRVQ